MTKNQLVQLLATRTQVHRQTAERAVTIIFESLGKALVERRRVEIRGLGSFKVRQYGGYKGHNPRTQEPVAVFPKVLPQFKMGKEMTERLNKRRKG